MGTPTNHTHSPRYKTRYRSGTRSNSAISQDGLPQIPSQTTETPPPPHPPHSRYKTRYRHGPFTNSPIPQVGLSQYHLGPWKVPTNPHHPYPTRCKCRYRLRPHNNRAGLSPSQPMRDNHQPISHPTQTSINPGTVPDPSAISLDYPNPLPAKKGHPPTHPPPTQPGKNPGTVPDPINNRPTPIPVQGGHPLTTKLSTQHGINPGTVPDLLKNHPELSQRPSQPSGHLPTHPTPDQPGINPGTVPGSSTIVLDYPNAPPNGTPINQPHPRPNLV